jgi:hypothetical protein
VLICGPPGAGKTTIARQLARSEQLRVFDRDDTEWASERQFAAALRKLGQSSSARAVVIRSGATRTARGRAVKAVRPDEVRLIDTPLTVCLDRIRGRGGNTRRDIAAAKKWWQTFEPGSPVLPVDQPKKTTAQRGYGGRHQALRRRWAPKVTAGIVSCARCGRPIRPGERWDLGHHDDDRTRYQGPEHTSCNRATAGRRKQKEPSGRSREW